MTMPPPPPRRGYTVGTGAPTRQPRPAPVWLATVSVWLIGTMATASWPLALVPGFTDKTAILDGRRLVIMGILTAITAALAVLLGVFLWKGAMTAVIVTVVTALGFEAVGVMQVAQFWLDQHQGELSAAASFGRMVQNPARIMIVTMGVLGLVALTCLLLPTSMRWAGRTQRYRFVRRLQRRGHPAYQPPHYPPLP